MSNILIAESSPRLSREDKKTHCTRLNATASLLGFSDTRIISFLSHARIGGTSLNMLVPSVEVPAALVGPLSVAHALRKENERRMNLLNHHVGFH